MELPKRKGNRLKEYDYNSPGAYFITICTKDKKQILSNIAVGTGILDGPKIILTEQGKIADKYIKQLNDFYKNISVDNYCIMPNHIHILLQVFENEKTTITRDMQNSVVSKFVGTFKRFCNKEYGENVWQSRSYDHIVRGYQDYKEIYEYINNNPTKWAENNMRT